MLSTSAHQIIPEKGTYFCVIIYEFVKFRLDFPPEPATPNPHLF